MNLKLNFFKKMYFAKVSLQKTGQIIKTKKCVHVVKITHLKKTMPQLQEIKLP